MGRPHVVAVPYSAQGHVIPLLELMQSLAKHGFEITFVNTDFNHKRIMNALSKEDNVGDLVNFVWLPDGMEPWEDRNDLRKLSVAIKHVMLGKLEKLVQNINRSNKEYSACVISDLGWVLQIAEKLQIKRAYFCSAATVTMGLTLSAQKWIDVEI